MDGVPYNRRNIIPNPYRPNSEFWIPVEVGGHLTSYNPGDVHGEVTSSGAQVGITWAGAPQIPLHEGERYALAIDRFQVLERPNGGRMHVVLLYLDNAFRPNGSYFSPEYRETDGEVSATYLLDIPEGSTYVRPAIIFVSAPGTSDATGTLGFSIEGIMIEPLGKPIEQVSYATKNLISDPSVEYGGNGWSDHTEGCTDVDRGPRTFWASDGTYSFFSRGTSGSSTLPNGLKGFAGNYLLPDGQVGWDVKPGDIVRFEIDTKITHAPDPGDPLVDSADPGLFLEIFFYHYDGDPSHTYVALQSNGPTMYKKDVIGDVRRLSHSAVCPPGANVIQVVCVMAAATASKEMAFYADRAMLTINQEIPEEYFDGDKAGSAWVGLPGKSASINPGQNNKMPGVYADGYTNGWNWDGVPNKSISTQLKPPLWTFVGSNRGKTLDFARAIRKAYTQT